MKRILIVDDNQSCLVLARNILREQYHVNAVTSGEQAITFVTRNRPDLIILDLNMPGISGEETLRRIRELVEGCKVILLSGQDEEKTRTMCVSLKADSYLIKPYMPERLTLAVSQLLS